MKKKSIWPWLLGGIVPLLALAWFSGYMPLPARQAQPTATVSTPGPDGPTAAAETAQPVNRDVIAPQFTLHDLDGNEVSLSDKRGQIVLLNFWATW